MIIDKFLTCGSLLSFLILQGCCFFEQEENCREDQDSVCVGFSKWKCEDRVSKSFSPEADAPELETLFVFDLKDIESDSCKFAQSVSLKNISSKDVMVTIESFPTSPEGWDKSIKAFSLDAGETRVLGINKKPELCDLISFKVLSYLER